MKISRIYKKFISMIGWFILWIASFPWLWYYGMPFYIDYLYFYMYFSGIATLLIMVADLSEIYKMTKDYI
ncbi:MAG: hypothetical protein ACFE9N_00460 [Promethearchaeota archaeon]